LPNTNTHSQTYISRHSTNSVPFKRNKTNPTIKQNIKDFKTNNNNNKNVITIISLRMENTQANIKGLIYKTN
jgi:hypothetical protein